MMKSKDDITSLDGNMPTFKVYRPAPVVALWYPSVVVQSCSVQIGTKLTYTSRSLPALPPVLPYRYYYLPALPAHPE